MYYDYLMSVLHVVILMDSSIAHGNNYVPEIFIPVGLQNFLAFVGACHGVLRARPSDHHDQCYHNVNKHAL